MQPILSEGSSLEEIQSKNGRTKLQHKQIFQAANQCYEDKIWNTATCYNN